MKNEKEIIVELEITQKLLDEENIMLSNQPSIAWQRGEVDETTKYRYMNKIETLRWILRD